MNSPSKVIARRLGRVSGSDVRDLVSTEVSASRPNPLAEVP
jgi:hypothetical protein